MNSTFEWVLPNLVIYGAPLLLTYIGSLGIPFPITLVVMAAESAGKGQGASMRIAFDPA